MRRRPRAADPAGYLSSQRRLRSLRNIRVAPTNLAETVLRAAFIVVFGVTGFLLGREAYFSLLSPHFANEAFQLAFLILSPVIGAVVGALLAPFAQALFEVQLRQTEGAMERLTPAEIAGGAVGLVVGLLVPS